MPHAAEVALPDGLTALHIGLLEFGGDGDMIPCAGRDEDYLMYADL